MRESYCHKVNIRWKTDTSKLIFATVKIGCLLNLGFKRARKIWPRYGNDFCSLAVLIKSTRKSVSDFSDDVNQNQSYLLTWFHFNSFKCLWVTLHYIWISCFLYTISKLTFDIWKKEIQVLWCLDRAKNSENEASLVISVYIYISK